jgi:hypothetical protein
VTYLYFVEEMISGCIVEKEGARNSVDRQRTLFLR